MGDRLATIDTVRKEKGGGCAPFEFYLSTKWHLDPFSRLATTDMGRKLGGCGPLGGAGWI